MGLSLNNVSMDYFLRGVDAAKSLKALDKFTGRQLAEAFGADGKIGAGVRGRQVVLCAL